MPNVLRVYGYRPERLSAWLAHFGQLQEPTENLTAADREMIAVVVSSLNRCTYCMVSHSASLREHLGDAALADRIAVNWRHAGLSGKQLAICEFAELLTVAPHTLSAADLERLEAVGLSREEVWDVAEIASMFAFTNRLTLATGMMPNIEYYERPARSVSGRASLPRISSMSRPRTAAMTCLRLESGLLACTLSRYAATAASSSTPAPGTGPGQLARLWI